VQRLELRRSFVPCFVMLIVVAHAQSGLPKSKIYRSPDGEYTVEYPSNWVHYPEAQSLYILNFPLNQMVREVLLPDHGAMITFATTRPKPKSLQEWIEKAVKSRVLISRRDVTVERAAQSAPLSITEIVSKSSRGNQEFEQVDWFFSVDDHLFDAVLLYHKLDTEASEYWRVLRRVVSSIMVRP
jgi:hypothetical protein